MRHPDSHNGAVATGTTPTRAAAASIASALVLMAGALLSPGSPAFSADLTEAEARGKYIYEEGKSRSRRIITADLQRGQAPSPASFLPCVNCHGVDGRGAKDYVGIAPLNVNWYALASTGGHQHSLRSHRSFDEMSLARSIILGVDPDGNKQDRSMPRYNITEDDMGDLIAYLKVMDSQSDPGMSATTLRIGTVLPTQGQHAELGHTMRSTIEAVFNEVNAAGGVHDRVLELVVGGWGANEDPQIWAARDLVSNQPVVALVSPYLPNYDADLEALATEKRLPVVGPYTVLQPNGENENRFTFYLLAGLELQVEALVQAASTKLTPADTSLAIVYPRVQFFDGLAAAAKRRAEALGFAAVTEHVFPLSEFAAKSTAVSLRENGTSAVLFLGSAPELVQFGRAAAVADWTPLLLSPGLLAERNVFELPESLNRQVLLAYASLPTDYSPKGSAEFEALHEKYDFGYQHSIAQVNAYTAAKILVAGLKQAGRRLTREQLMLTLESLDNFHAGLAPPVSYDENRRTGSVGVHIVPVNLTEGRFTEPVRWIVPDSAD